MKVLVTGNAGFIGFHVARALLARGDAVVGIDSVNDYYSTQLKEDRLAELERAAAAAPGAYEHIRGDLAVQETVDRCFERHRFDRVIHLAAQAGLRYSLKNPRAYVSSNLLGFTNVLEACRAAATPHLTYASSSSVYGANTTMPYSEHHGVDHPLQFYAATKRANELMAHAYSHLFRIPTTGLRFFTVYGPWGRPDMAMFLFTRNIIEGKPIDLFNEGRHTRDFTYIDDIVAGVIASSDDIAAPDPDWKSERPDPASSNAPYRVFNIGNNGPVQLLDYIDAIETAVGRKAIRNLLPRNAEDALDTYADVSALAARVGYRPGTPVNTGVGHFVRWYREYYRV